MTENLNLNNFLGDLSFVALRVTLRSSTVLPHQVVLRSFTLLILKCHSVYFGRQNVNIKKNIFPIVSGLCQLDMTNGLG